MRYKSVHAGLLCCLLGPYAADGLAWDSIAPKPPITVEAHRTPPPVQIRRYRCLDDQEPVAFQSRVCLEPASGTCTAYYCRDPQTHQTYLATPTLFGDTNPHCEQDAMQTEACTNDYRIEERYLPSTKELVLTMPMIYPVETLAVPFFPAGKDAK